MQALPPGLSNSSAVDVLVPEAAEGAHPQPRVGGQLAFVFTRLRSMRAPFFAFLVVLVLALISIASWLGLPLSPFRFDETSGQLLASPSWQHPMGTDELGRDLFCRIIYGSRLSMSIGFVTAAMAFVIGTIYGSLAGLKGGWYDAVLMRVVDVIYSLPDLLVLILVGVILPFGIGRSTLGIIIALSLIGWMGTARIVRAQLIQLKNEEFVEAALALGQDQVALLLKHLLPNALGPIVVTLTFAVPAAILSESTLSFIGLGLCPPACSWGTLAFDGWRALRSHPHLIFFPSLFIFITVLSFNLLGDGLRDALDPRIRLRVR